jgi:hypothetical protein
VLLEHPPLDNEVAHLSGVYLKFSVHGVGLKFKVSFADRLVREVYGVESALNSRALLFEFGLEVYLLLLPLLIQNFLDVERLWLPSYLLWELLVDNLILLLKFFLFSGVLVKFLLLRLDVQLRVNI